MRLGKIGFVVACLWVFCAGEAAPGQEQPTIRAESTVVMVPTLVRDHDRNSVYGLKAEDFIIEDEGVAQTVHLDEEVQDRPASIVVIVQLGRRADYELPRIQGLASMLSPLLTEGHAVVSVVTFDSHVHQLTGFTGEEKKVTSTLHNLDPGDGGAAIIDAVDYGLKLLDGTPNNRQRVLLLVSETRDHGSHHKTPDVLRALGNSNTVVYALSFSPAKANVLDTLKGTNNPDLHPDEPTEIHEGPDILAPIVLLAQAARKNASKTIAAMTGGEYANFSSGKHFDSDLTEFTNHLYARYLLSFAPSKPHPGLHHLVVKLKDPGKDTVLARESYWVAPPENSAPAQ